MRQEDLLKILWVWTDKKAYLAKLWVRMRPDRADPSFNKTDFVRRNERRRTHVKQKRLCRVQPDVVTKLVARSARLGNEPAIVSLRTSDNHFLR